VVVDQPASIGALPVAVARACGHQVAYLPGMAMRRVADLHPGAAKTDACDAYVIADAGRSRWPWPAGGRSCRSPLDLASDGAPLVVEPVREITCGELPTHRHHTSDWPG
jgi:hypothetical protein